MKQGTSLATYGGKAREPSQTVLLGHNAAGFRAILPRPDARPGYRETRVLPLNRRAFRTARPPRVFIRARKPWTRCRRRTLGCHVRFGIPSPFLSDSQHPIIYALSPCCKVDGSECSHHHPASPETNSNRNLACQCLTCILQHDLIESGKR